MLGGVIVFGAATIVFGLSRSFPLSLAALFVVGAADMFSVFVRSSLIQLHTPDAMRGRVGAVSQLTISASNELGEAQSGFLAAITGPVAAAVIGGAGAIVVTLAYAGFFPELRRARSFDPPSPTPLHPKPRRLSHEGREHPETIGNTPHIRVNRLFGDRRRCGSSPSGSNPGASIKDRIALAMVEDASVPER
jgi:MFS family permease